MFNLFKGKTQSLADLKRDLDQIGIKASDKILIHTSLRSIGKIEGGANGLIDLLTSQVSQGTLVVPTHTWQDINAKNPRFIQDKTPVCIGTLPEVFRKSPGVIRSAHPTHSNAAWGKNAKELMAGQEKFDTPCAPESTYGRLGEEDFKILLLGVDFGRNTAIHGLEEQAKVPGRLTVEREALEVELSDGTVVPSPQHRHTGPGSDNYVRIQDELHEQGILQYAKLGRAKVMHMRAKELFPYVVNKLILDPEYFVRELK